eukprot:m.19299 g.19299  ORF g.19299 m.19299 type:complete len:486 (-) comp8437_c1_seq2:67-1524(-)
MNEVVVGVFVVVLLLPFVCVYGRPVGSDGVSASILRYNGTKRAVSISFDDTSDCQLTFAAEQLNKLGLRGTFYAAISRIDDIPNTIDPVGKMAVPKRLPADYKWKLINEAIVKQGHELGCHMYEHLVLNDKATKGMVDRDLNNWEKRIREMVPGYDTRDVTLAYPKGRNTQNTRTWIGERFLGGRVVTTTCTEGKLHLHHQPKDEVDRLKIMGCEPHNDGLVDTYYNKMLEQEQGWFVFIYHGIKSCAHRDYEDAMLTRKLTAAQKTWMDSIPRNTLNGEMYFQGRNKISVNRNENEVTFMGLQRRGNPSDTLSCQWGWASYSKSGVVRDWSKLAAASKRGQVWVAPVRDVLKYEIQWACLQIAAVENLVPGVRVVLRVRNTCSGNVGPGGWPINPLPVAMELVSDEPFSVASVSCVDASKCTAKVWKDNLFFMHVKDNSFGGEFEVHVHSDRAQPNDVVDAKRIHDKVDKLIRSIMTKNKSSNK